MPYHIMIEYRRALRTNLYDTNKLLHLWCVHLFMLVVKRIGMPHFSSGWMKASGEPATHLLLHQCLQVVHLIWIPLCR